MDVENATKHVVDRKSNLCKPRSEWHDTPDVDMSKKTSHTLTQSSSLSTSPITIHGITTLPFARAHSICFESFLLLPISSIYYQFFIQVPPRYADASSKAQSSLIDNTLTPVQVCTLIFQPPLKCPGLRSAAMLFFIYNFHHAILLLEK